MNYDGSPQVVLRNSNPAFVPPEDSYQQTATYAYPRTRVCLPQAEAAPEGGSVWVSSGPGGNIVPTHPANLPFPLYSVNAWGGLSPFTCATSTKLHPKSKQKRRNNPGKTHSNKHLTEPRDSNETEGEKMAQKTEQKGKQSWADHENEVKDFGKGRSSQQNQRNINSERIEKFYQDLDYFRDEMKIIIGSFRQTILEEHHTLRELIRASAKEPPRSDIDSEAEAPEYFSEQEKLEISRS